MLRNPWGFRHLDQTWYCSLLSHSNLHLDSNHRKTLYRTDLHEALKHCSKGLFSPAWSFIYLKQSVVSWNLHDEPLFSVFMPNRVCGSRERPWSSHVLSLGSLAGRRWKGEKWWGDQAFILFHLILHTPLLLGVLTPVAMLQREDEMCLYKPTSSPLSWILLIVSVNFQVEVSPLENAIYVVENKTQELRTLISQYQHRQHHGNINPLSMCLNGVIDAAVNGGIARYQEVDDGKEFICRFFFQRIGEIRDPHLLLLVQTGFLWQGLHQQPPRGHGEDHTPEGFDAGTGQTLL